MKIFFIHRNPNIVMQTHRMLLKAKHEPFIDYLLGDSELPSLKRLMSECNLIVFIPWEAFSATSFDGKLWDTAKEVLTPKFVVDVGGQWSKSNGLLFQHLSGITIENCSAEQQIPEAITNYCNGKRPRRVFLSYSRKNSSAMKRLRRELSRSMHSVWVDNSALQYGATFPEQINSAIESCDIFLPLWSQHAAASEWVRKEIELARAYSKFIVPVLLDFEPLPREIQDLHGFASYESVEFRKFFSIPEPQGGLFVRLLKKLSKGS